MWWEAYGREKEKRGGGGRHDKEMKHVGVKVVR